MPANQGDLDSQSASRRRWAWNVARVAVTLAAVAYVVSRIDWMDSLRLPDDQVVWGWREERADHAAFVATDGQEYPIPPPSHDRMVSDAFMPGFATLLRTVRRRELLTAFAIFPACVLFMAMRWQWLLRTHGLDPGFREALRLTWLGMLANNVLPGSTGGDFAKGYCIYRRTPGKRLPAVMTVLVDRVLGLIALMVVGAIAILLESDLDALDWPSQFVQWFLLATLVVGIVFFSGRVRRLFRVTEILARLPFNEKIQKLDDSMFHYRGHLRTLVACMGISFVLHGWTIGCIYLIGQALRIPVDLVHYFVFLPVIFTVGAVAPSVAGLGVLEGLFQQFFSLVGATPASAVAMCILYRVMMLLASLPGAVPFYHEFSTGGVKSLSSLDDSPSDALEPQGSNL